MMILKSYKLIINEETIPSILIITYNDNMSLTNYINTDSYAYIAPLFFVLMILIMFTIGFINGLRASLYFGAVNCFGYIMSLLVAIFTFKKIIKFIPGQINILGNDVNFSSIINTTQDTIKAFIVTIITLTTYFIFLFISFIFYWFLRKRLKRKIFEYKKNDKSLLSNRFMGGSVSLLYMMPLITSITSVLSIFSKESAFTNLNSSLSSAFSFNQINNLRGKSVSIYETVQSAKEILKVGNSFQAIFGAASDGDGKKALSEIMTNHYTKDALKYLLTNNDVIDNLNIIKFISPPIPEHFHLDINTKVGYHAPLNSAIEISQEKLSRLNNSISKLITGWNNSTATPEGVKNFLISAGILKIV